MPTSLRCPHCHSLVELQSMDIACSAMGEWRICPACDEAVLFRPRLDDAPAVPVRGSPRPLAAEAKP